MTMTDKLCYTITLVPFHHERVDGIERSVMCNVICEINNCHGNMFATLINLYGIEPSDNIDIVIYYNSQLLTIDIAIFDYITIMIVLIWI